MVTKTFLEFDSFKCFSIYMLKSIEKCSQLELANKCDLSLSWTSFQTVSDVWNITKFIKKFKAFLWEEDVKLAKFL